MGEEFFENTPKIPIQTSNSDFNDQPDNKYIMKDNVFKHKYKLGRIRIRFYLNPYYPVLMPKQENVLRLQNPQSTQPRAPGGK